MNTPRQGSSKIRTEHRKHQVGGLALAINGLQVCLRMDLASDRARNAPVGQCREQTPGLNAKTARRGPASPKTGTGSINL